MNDEDFGKMAADIKHLIKATERIEKRFEDHWQIDEAHQEKFDTRLTEVEETQAKQKGFMIGLTLLFPTVSSILLWLADHFKGD